MPWFFGTTRAGDSSQGNRTVDVDMHGWVCAHLQPARLTELDTSIKLNGIVALPPLLEKQGSLSVRLTSCGWIRQEPLVGTPNG